MDKQYKASSTRTCSIDARPYGDDVEWSHIELHFAWLLEKLQQELELRQLENNQTPAPLGPTGSSVLSKSTQTSGQCTRPYANDWLMVDFQFRCMDERFRVQLEQRQLLADRALLDATPTGSLPA
jgi:hypothetical protein